VNALLQSIQCAGIIGKHLVNTQQSEATVTPVMVWLPGLYEELIAATEARY
jgi:hypothetical protein